MRILIRNGLNYAISTSACGNILNKQGITKLQIYFSKKKFREEKLRLICGLNFANNLLNDFSWKQLFADGWIG